MDELNFNREHNLTPSTPSTPSTTRAQNQVQIQTQTQARAILLVGGYGTRLRPLTFSVAKPLVPFCNVPIVIHQIEALSRVGVREIVLAINYQPETMTQFLKKAETQYGVTIHMSKENEPLGTAGPLALAREILGKDEKPFFMLNSDVVCEFPLEDMLNYHRSHGGEGTLLVTEVKEPAKYGVVVSNDNGQIVSFVEKPQVFVSNKINAGIYLFNPSILKRIELRPMSIEREVFPKMAADKQIFSLSLHGYWMDVGQPKDFVAGTTLHLNFLRKHSPEQLTNGTDIVGNVMIAPDAKIGNNVEIGPDVVIGSGVIIEDGARIKFSTLLAGVHVGTHAFVQKSIIGWHSKIGAWARVQDCVFGEDVTIAKEIFVNWAIICPHKELKEDSPTAQIVL